MRTDKRKDLRCAIPNRLLSLLLLGSLAGCQTDGGWLHSYDLREPQSPGAVSVEKASYASSGAGASNRNSESAAGKTTRDDQSVAANSSMPETAARLVSGPMPAEPGVVQIDFAQVAEETDDTSAEPSSGDEAELGEVPPVGPEPIDFPRPEQGGVSLQEVENLAISVHPALSQARSNVNAAYGDYVQAGLPFNPILRYQGNEIGNNGNAGMHSILMSQEYVTANKLGIASGMQARRTHVRSAELKKTELEVLTRVRTEFARTLVAQERVELTNQIVELSQKSLDSVEALLEAKEVSRVALLQARVEAEQARIDARNAETQLEQSRRALAAAVGVDHLPGTLLVGQKAAGLTEEPWQQLLSEIQAMSPELAAANSRLDQAKWALKLARAEVTPNVTGQVGMGVASSGDAIGSVQISVPLPIRNRNEGNIMKAQAEIAAANASIRRTELDLEQRLAQAVTRYRTALQRYQRLESQVIPDAEETFELSKLAFEAGQTDYLQLLTTQRTLFATRLSQLDSLLQAKEAKAEIDGLLVTLPSTTGRM